MYQLLYVSTAAWTLSPHDLNDILDVSRENNRRLGITGMLLHMDNGFLQILEGPKETVMEVYNGIASDPRHAGAQVLLFRESEARLFGEWTMGFDKPNAAKQASDPVFAITRQAIENAINPEKAAELAVLLRNFYYVNAGNCAA